MLLAVQADLKDEDIRKKVSTSTLFTFRQITDDQYWLSELRRKPTHRARMPKALLEKIITAAHRT